MTERMMKTCAAMLAAMLFTASCGGGGTDAATAVGSPTPAIEREARAVALRSTAVAVDYTRLVQQLYVAHFGRPADPGALANFGAALADAGAPTDIKELAAAYESNPRIRSLVDALSGSNEFITLFGAPDSQTTYSYVVSLYNTILNRHPNLAGLQFWADAIDSGRLTRGNAAMAIMAGALANTSPQGLLDAALVERRIAAATRFSNALATEAQVFAYSGRNAAGTGREMLRNITNELDAAALQEQVDQAVRTVTGVIFDTIAIQNTSISQQRLVVISDEASWRALWAEHALASQEPAPAIDFNERMVIGVFPGIFYPVGSTLRIRRIHQSGGTNYVEYRYTPPTCIVCPQAFSLLGHIVSIPRSPYPFVFVEQQ